MFHRPTECGFCTEDLECLGCGWKMYQVRDKCGAEENHKSREEETRRKELAQLERLKAKYEPER